jgi:3-phosphoshikimate 1-carboxyvinyltransferase
MEATLRSGAYSTLEVRPVTRLEGTLTLPGDKSISHRAVMFAGLAEGDTTITHFLPGEDCVSTLRAMQALGVRIEHPEPERVVVHGAGGKLRAACEPLDCGNSGTSMRLLAGILAGQTFSSKLVGDRSLSSRPMKRIMDPLEVMGGKIAALGEGGRPPLVIDGRPLKGISYMSPIASAQLKSCVLLAGLFAQGTTSVAEPGQSRDHTERLLRHFHVPVKQEGGAISIRGGVKLQAEDLRVPGDFSSAAFWIAAAACLPGASLEIQDVGLNPTRTAALSILLRMGAHIQESVVDHSAEPKGILRVQGRRLRGTRIAGPEIPNAIDELPILAVAAALSDGDTTIADATELRVKETDRIAAMAGNLRAFGVEVDEHPDGMTIHGGASLRGASVPSFGDHRIAMACAILGLFAKGPTVIEDTGCIATSYPAFADDLKTLTNPRSNRPRAASE